MVVGDIFFPDFCHIGINRIFKFELYKWFTNKQVRCFKKWKRNKKGVK